MRAPDLWPRLNSFLYEIAMSTITAFWLSFKFFWPRTLILIVLVLFSLFYWAQPEQSFSFLLLPTFPQLLNLRVRSLELLFHKTKALILWPARVFYVWMNVPSGAGCMNHSALNHYVLVLWIVVCVQQLLWWGNRLCLFPLCDCWVRLVLFITHGT